METLIKNKDIITLGQAAKAAGLVDLGSEAKAAIQGGRVLLNGEVCTMRGKKLNHGDIIGYNGNFVKILDKS